VAPRRRSAAALRPLPLHCRRRCRTAIAAAAAALLLPPPPFPTF
jgi:hypothetical protein